MIYITTQRAQAYHQMTLDDLFNEFYRPIAPSRDHGITYTRKVEGVPPSCGEVPVDWYIDRLRAFNEDERIVNLRSVPRESLYDTFRIPKKSGGLRRIDAPNDELKAALTILKTLLETDFRALHHTCAFAYVKKRSTYMALQRHQRNESKWFAKLDLSNFFGSTTLDFVMNQMAMIFPFSEVVKRPEGKAELEKALELGFLNGGLPQGTPLSPTLTNIMMIPVDFEISKALRDRLRSDTIVYTRYADDFLFSGKKWFSVNVIQSIVMDILHQFKAPFALNKEKTRFGNNFGSGANWNLGLMLNKDNDISVGHRNKKRFEAMVFSFAEDTKLRRAWDPADVQHVLGLYSYYHMIESQRIDDIVSGVEKKTGVQDVIGRMRQAVA